MKPLLDHSSLILNLYCTINIFQLFWKCYIFLDILMETKQSMTHFFVEFLFKWSKVDNIINYKTVSKLLSEYNLSRYVGTRFGVYLANEKGAVVFS